MLNVKLNSFFPWLSACFGAMRVCVYVHVMFVRASSYVSMFEMSSVNIFHLLTDVGSALTLMHTVINLLLHFVLSTDKIQSLEDWFQTGRLSFGVKESHARMTHLNVDVEILIFVEFLFPFFILCTDSE